MIIQMVNQFSFVHLITFELLVQKVPNSFLSMKIKIFFCRDCVEVVIIYSEHLIISIKYCFLRSEYKSWIIPS
jgi:hypothetical protein